MRYALTLDNDVCQLFVSESGKDTQRDRTERTEGKLPEHRWIPSFDLGLGSLKCALIGLRHQQATQGKFKFWTHFRALI